MEISVKVDGIKQAEQFSAICQNYPYEMFLRSGAFCIDPKSMLGVLAIFYSAKENVMVDTGDMEDSDISNFVKDISDFIKE